MLMNWPERLWIYSPFRIISQKKEVDEWLRLPVEIEVDKALEIGCGLGRGARLLVQKMRFKHVFAFDLEDTLVKRAASSIPKHLADNISFYVGDAQVYPLMTQYSTQSSISASFITSWIGDDAFEKSAGLRGPGAFSILKKSTHPCMQMLF